MPTAASMATALSQARDCRGSATVDEPASLASAALAAHPRQLYNPSGTSPAPGSRSQSVGRYQPPLLRIYRLGEQRYAPLNSRKVQCEGPAFRERLRVPACR
jgi:hypothetical protein